MEDFTINDLLASLGRKQLLIERQGEIIARQSAVIEQQQQLLARKESAGEQPEGDAAAEPTDA